MEAEEENCGFDFEKLNIAPDFMVNPMKGIKKTKTIFSLDI